MFIVIWFRAQFDHQRKIFDPSYKPIRQAAVLCTFCYKAISSDILRQGKIYCICVNDHHHMGTI